MSKDAYDTSRPCIVIASPYAGDIEQNLRYARACVNDSINRGEAPFAPHLIYTHPAITNDLDPEQRLRGIGLGMCWGRVAKGLAVYKDRGISPGMLDEVDNATKFRIPVDYRTIPDWKNADPSIPLPLTQQQRSIQELLEHAHAPTSVIAQIITDVGQRESDFLRLAALAQRFVLQPGIASDTLARVSLMLNRLGLLNYELPPHADDAGS